MFGLNSFPVTSTYAVSNSNSKATRKFLFESEQDSLRTHTLWVSQYVLQRIYLEKINLSLGKNGKRYIEVLFSFMGENMRLCIFPDLEKLRKVKKKVNKLSKVFYDNSEFVCEEDLPSDIVEKMSMFVADFIAKTALG